LLTPPSFFSLDHSWWVCCSCIHLTFPGSSTLVRESPPTFRFFRVPFSSLLFHMCLLACCSQHPVKMIRLHSRSPIFRIASPPFLFFFYKRQILTLHGHIPHKLPLSFFSETSQSHHLESVPPGVFPIQTRINLLFCVSPYFIHPIFRVPLRLLRVLPFKPVTFVPLCTGFSTLSHNFYAPFFTHFPSSLFLAFSLLIPFLRFAFE